MFNDPETHIKPMSKKRLGERVRREYADVQMQDYLAMLVVIVIDDIDLRIIKAPPRCALAVARDKVSYWDNDEQGLRAIYQSSRCH